MSSNTLFFERYKNKSDEYGFNPAPFAGVEPFFRFMFKQWFKAKIANIENIPSEGNAVLFGNHSGVIPIDACLLYDGVIRYHPVPRRIRYLVTKFLLNFPRVGDCLKGYGAIPADLEIATDLLRKKELVFIYPEGEKGTGKLFKNRYKLVDFHDGFVRAALKTESPMVPVVTIGGDEIYPLLGNLKLIAKIIKAPYFPISLFFPWLPPPFCLVPLPVRILICTWPSFRLKYSPLAADDEDLVKEIASDIRCDIQTIINDLLAIRKAPFAAWDMNAVNAYLASGPKFWVSKKHWLES